MTKKKIQKNEGFNESLSFSFNESNIDEDKRTVRVCALAACVSKNGRFYSPQIVESVSGTLKGKKSFADHDDRDTKNLVGRIVSENYKDGKIYADIKISKAGGVAKSTWEKIKDGTITDVSIAANGITRPVKLGEQDVDEVTSLDVRSVDFVTEGGVEGAQVMRVYENIEDIPKISEVKEKMIEKVEDLRSEYPDLVEEIEKPLKEQLESEIKLKEEAQTKLTEKEMAEYKASKIESLKEEDSIKKLLVKKVSGKTNEEVDASIEKELAGIKEVIEATKKEAKIEGVAETVVEETKEEPKSWTRDRIMEDSRIPDGLKIAACERLVLEGSEVMKEWLKDFFKIEL